MRVGPRDRDLIKVANNLILERYRPGRHEIAAALRAASGKVYAAVHTDGSIGHADLCAEWGAIAMAVTAGDDVFDTIVAVKYQPKRRLPIVVPPCGLCREILSDFGDIQVILSAVRKVSVFRLLPSKYWNNRH